MNDREAQAWFHKSLAVRSSIGVGGRWGQKRRQLLVFTILAPV